jgi:hypothetical protein
MAPISITAAEDPKTHVTTISASHPDLGEEPIPLHQIQHQNSGTVQTAINAFKGAADKIKITTDIAGIHLTFGHRTRDFAPRQHILFGSVARNWLLRHAPLP